MIDNKRSFLAALKKARKLNEEVAELRAKILDGVEDLLCVPFDALNADNLDEAIQCYIDYDELPKSGNLEDFWEAYRDVIKQNKEEEIDE